MGCTREPSDSLTISMSPAAFSASIVEVTSAFLASGLLSNSDSVACCVRHAELTLKRRLLNGRLDLTCTQQRSCNSNTDLSASAASSASDALVTSALAC